MGIVPECVFVTPFPIKNLERCDVVIHPLSHLSAIFEMGRA